MRQITEEFLLEIFYISLKENNYFQAVKEHLKTNYILDEDYRRVWENIVKYYNSKKSRPTVGSLIQKLADDNVKGKNDGVIAVLQEVKSTVIVNGDKIMTEFEEFIKQNKFIELYAETGKMFNDGNKDKAYDRYIKGSQEIHDFSLAESKFKTVFKDFFNRMTDRLIGCNNQPIQIPFMIPEIDEATDGGAYTGETELWLGDSGIGKSKLLVTRSISSARSGNDVLHIQAEGTERQCMDNFDACWTGQLYKDLKRGEFNAAKTKAYSQIIKTIGGEIYVKSFEQFGKVTTVMIRNYLIQLLKSGVNIKHLVIDYLDLIEPISEFGDRYGSGSDGERLRQMEVVRQFKSIATEFNILVTTATQSSDIPLEFSESETNVIKRNHLGNAKRKVEPFSYFFTINQSPRERRAHQVRIHAEKLRDHPSGDTWRFAQSLKNSRFYDKLATAKLHEEYDEDEEEMLREMKENNKKTKKNA